MSRPPPGAGEFDLIAWLRARTPATGPTRIGIGDDCASIAITPGAELLVTTDMLMDGRHFRLGEATAAEIGHKCLAVNLSDVAAMAGRAVAAVVAVALPRSIASETFAGLREGMAPLADRLGVAIVGGDTNAWDGPLVVGVTALGEAIPPGPVTRSGARVGDAVLVTGPLGGSLARGRHLRPEPRLAEAGAIHAVADIHAMIDLSDGLSSDLRHILDASGGLGADLLDDAIPIHPDALLAASIDGRAPIDHALDDGEDFELCLAVSEADARRLLDHPPGGASLTRIGAIVGRPGVRLIGSGRRVEPGGFDHLRR